MQIAPNPDGGMRRAKSALLMFAFVVPLALGGCERLGSKSEDFTARDVQQIKLMVERLLDDEASRERQNDYRLRGIEDKLQTRNEVISANLTDIDSRIRSQNEEISSLRKEIDQLAFQIGALTTKLDIQAAQTSAATAQMLDSTPPGEATFKDAQGELDLENYETARAGFEKALDEGPARELGIEIRYWLAETCFRQADYSAADQHYMDLIQSNPRHPLAWRSLERVADLRKMQGDLEQSAFLYETIVNGHPEYDEIDRVRIKLKELQEAAPGPSSRTEPDELEQTASQ